LVTAFEGGVIQYLATSGNTKAAKNPHTTGEVVAAMSSFGNSHPSHLVAQQGPFTRNRTKDEPNSWVAVDLGKDRSLLPSDYCARHGWDNKGQAVSAGRLRSWDFEGSNDGSNYTVLRAHKNDKSLAAQAFSVAAWKVEGANQAYRYFRIRQTGPNASDGDQLYCAGIELYGMLQSR
jgi:hypothetical protein